MARIGELHDLQDVMRRARPERTLITTYCASLSYLESGLLDALRVHGRPRVRVLIDAGQLAECRGEVGVKYPGVRYERFAVTAGGGFRFHPKTYALLNEHSATVIVASANLTVPGFRSNWEVFDVLEIQRGTDGQTSGDRHAIAAYARFLERMADGAVFLAPEGQQTVREVATDLRELLRAGVPTPEEGPFFLHSLDEPILKQIQRIIPSDAVGRITAYSPYYDGGAQAVREMVKAYPKAKHVDVVLDPSSAGAFNGRSLIGLAKRLRVHRASSPESAAIRFLHAKLIAFETLAGTWIVTGSANMTAAGLCGAAAPASGIPTGNVEAVTVRLIEDRGVATRLLSVVPRTPWEDWSTSTVTIQIENEASNEDTFTVFDAALDDQVVRCIVSAHRWEAGGHPPCHVSVSVETPDQCATLKTAAAVVNGEVVEIEAICEDPALRASEQATRVFVEASYGSGRTARVRRGWGWLRRPQELSRSASSVSMRERLRPLRQTPTPSAETLIELHHDLATALARLGQSDAANVASSTPGRARPAPTGPARPRAGRQSDRDTIDVEKLLRDEAKRREHGADARERPHEYLRAITETLRTHIAGPSTGPSEPIAKPGEGGQPARTANRRQHAGDDRGDRETPARTPARPPSALSHAASSELARLGNTFAGAVRRRAHDQ